MLVSPEEMATCAPRKRGCEMRYGLLKNFRYETDKLAMSIFGIGVDVVEVERIAALVEKNREVFVKRLFTAGERLYCDAQKYPALHYAARFAAKEAISKAFGTGIGKDVGWLEMEIFRSETGAPKVRLTGNTADFAARHGISEVSISLSHERNYAVANALAVVGRAC